MDVTSTVRQSTPLCGAFGVMGSAGLVAALFATYWDDAWHTDRGRDEFAIPPHLLLYGGVLLALISVLGWVRDARSRNGSLRFGRGTDRPMHLALAGAAVTMASAPIDNAWHGLYGRDAVLWSPPHLLGVAGTLTLTVGILAGLRRSQGRAADLARMVIAAGVIGALQIPVLEYDSDVPQFSTVWYLPVAIGGLAIAAVLLDLLTIERWAITKAAATYLVLRLAVVTFLSAAGFSTTIVVPILVPLALYECMRGRTQTIRLAALGISAPLVWWVADRLQNGTATTVSADTAAAMSAAAAAAALVVVAARSRHRLPGKAQVVCLVVATTTALGLFASPAWAHDPGQGTARADSTMSVERSSGSAAVTVDVSAPCVSYRPVRTVARRAGSMTAGTLQRSAERADRCRYTGTVKGLSTGRWFVYAEFTDQHDARVEVWVPAVGGTTTTLTRQLYTPPAGQGQRGQMAAAAAMLAIIAALLILDVSQARAIAASDPAAGRVGPGRVA